VPHRSNLTLARVLDSLVPTLGPIDGPDVPDEPGVIRPSDGLEDPALSGLPASLPNSPGGPDLPDLPVGVRRSAVLVPLFEENGETRVILTRRASTMRFHGSEVSFPGGKVELGESAAAAAVREAFEEVALDPGLVEVLGTLGPLSTLSSRARICPVVATLGRRPFLQASPSEVELVFDVALAELLVDGVHRSEHWGGALSGVEVHFYDLPADIVWGATARILTDLLGRVTGVSEPWAGGLA
jgi:8-oxo-dGTP pyrophosphatase MutT (NUDIX family)